MVKIANIFNKFQQAFKAPPPPRIAKFLKYPGSDSVKTDTWNTSTLLSHKPEYNKLRQI